MPEMIAFCRRRLAAGVVALVSLCISSAPALAQGCAMCRTAVEGQDDPLTRGLSRSVLFMVSMPFAVFFSAAGWLYVTHRRAKAATIPDEPGPEAVQGSETSDKFTTGGA